MKYRKRPVVIDAYQLPAAGEDVPDSFEQWCDEAGFTEFESDRDEGMLISTLEGTMRADPGDWIIKGVAGEFYPCKPDIFAATYEPVSDDAPSAPQAEPKREPLSDEQITKGEYVLATKWGDGDPGDHWGVGFYDRLENGRHYIVDSSGKQIRGNGFRRVGRITAGVGRWLLSAAKSLEASPPGTVNLWTMLTERAHRIGGTDPALDDLQAKERA